MREISAKEVAKMNDSDTVYVNRVTITLRLMELEEKGNQDIAALQILYDAWRQMNRKDNKSFGAKMQIKDIRTAFGDIEGMRPNSFRIS